MTEPKKRMTTKEMIIHVITLGGAWGIITVAFTYDLSKLYAIPALLLIMGSVSASEERKEK